MQKLALFLAVLILPLIVFAQNIELPITFEDGQLPVFNDFNGSATQVIANPDASGENDSATVAENIVPANAEFAGVNLYETNIDISTLKGFTMTVWSQVPDMPVLLILGSPGESLERAATTTTTGAWETISFDFSEEGDLTFESVTVFMNFNVVDPADQTYYWDNLEQVEGIGFVCDGPDGPDFYLSPNGVTVMCPRAPAGASGDPGNGIVYTKRAFSQITPQNAATTCTSCITDMSGLLDQNSTFNEDISSWDVSQVTNMSTMFRGASAFNQDLSYWDTGSVTNMSQMFLSVPINWDIGQWNVSSVTDMSGLFALSLHNQDISGWDVSNVIDMSNMFVGNYLFNQDLVNWYVSGVQDMSKMFFAGSNGVIMSFNGDISSWDVGSVSNMFLMFAQSDFNQDISGWDVSNVIDMSGMFSGSAFNQDLSGWNIISATNMGGMFANSAFDQNISGWDVSNVIDMSAMFAESAFNQDLSLWTFNTNVNLFEFADNSASDVSNYDLLLNSFYNQNLINKEFGDAGLAYCNETDHDALIIEKGWAFNGGTVLSPSISGLENLQIESDLGLCITTNVDLGQPTLEGCGTLSISNDAPSEYPIGITTVNWTLVDGNQTSVSATQLVEVIMVVDQADVCYVSSDSVFPENNRIFITSDPALNGQNVDFHEVLREDSSGDYQTIGFINPPEVSFLDIDSDNTSQAYRYKIETTDICGENYPESSFHKTILLQSGIASDNSINLSWTPYLGLDFSTYNIYKNTNGTGYELLTSLSFNNTTYNDTSANVVDNFYEYYISIEVASCGSDPLLPFNLRSNLELVNPNLSVNNVNLLGQEIHIYPNPASDYLNVSGSKGVEITAVSIYNAVGQRIFVTVEFENIYISNLSAGLYYISINTNKGVVNKTMIRE